MYDVRTRGYAQLLAVARLSLETQRQFVLQEAGQYSLLHNLQGGNSHTVVCVLQNRDWLQEFVFHVLRAGAGVYIARGQRWCAAQPRAWCSLVYVLACKWIQAAQLPDRFFVLTSKVISGGFLWFVPRLFIGRLYAVVYTIFRGDTQLDTSSE